MANPKNGDSVFVVIKNGAIQSIHASSESANAAIVEGSDIAIHKVAGGSVNIDAVEKKPKVKTDDAEKKKTKTSAAKSEPPAKKTKTPAEQRAANVDKPKRGQVEENTLPANVKKLLDGTGGTLSGMAICVTGVPPVMGRKNAEKLVEAYGGKLAKSLSKNTSLVVLGNNAGPKKLEQMEDLKIKTVDEDEFIAMIEAGAGKKRPVEEGNDDEEEDPKPKKTKKQKK